MGGNSACRNVRRNARLPESASAHGASLLVFMNVTTLVYICRHDVQTTFGQFGVQECAQACPDSQLSALCLPLTCRRHLALVVGQGPKAFCITCTAGTDVPR